MLSTAEIVELERKVVTYRIKQRMNYILYILVILIILSGIAYFFYLKHTTPIAQVQTTPIMENNTSTVLTPKDINISKNEIISKSAPVEETKDIKPIASSSESDGMTHSKSNEMLTLHLPDLKVKNIDKKVNVKEEYEKHFASKEEEINHQVLIRKKSSSPEETFYRSMGETIESNTMLAPPPLQEEKQKGIIKIETQDVNSIQYLKEKFEKTHNIIFALMLSEEYYLTKNYTHSNKWALIANSIDSDNEKSWIWFAKSKIKLGQKEDAIVALKAYLKNNKSNAVQSLLNQINFGEIND